MAITRLLIHQDSAGVIARDNYKQASCLHRGKQDAQIIITGPEPSVIREHIKQNSPATCAARLFQV